MFSPAEFSVGCVGDATTGLTLVLPRSQYENAILVTQASGSPYAIFLSEDHQFAGFECANNDSWRGILIPNVTIELDEESIFDAENMHVPLGALVRRGTQLDMVTRVDSNFPRPVKTPIIVDLPLCRQNMAAGFTKWRIFLGEGMRKRELKCVELGNKPRN
jgi:hypothetical protein